MLWRRGFSHEEVGLVGYTECIVRACELLVGSRKNGVYVSEKLNDLIRKAQRKNDPERSFSLINLKIKLI